ncbi:cytochrome P450, partial [Salmonella sp. s58078]|uniref:cytochrome P450 n=1 Tax=Salmonella sp. s58078 TaxID=3159699 RepID=UPI00397FF9C2
MKTHDLAFADRAGTLAMEIITYNKSEIGFAPYSDYLRQMKRICVLDLLSAKRVKSYQPIREREVANMIDVIRKTVGTPINLSALFSKLNSSIVSTTVFGENIYDQGVTVDLSLVADVLSLVDGFNLADFFPSLKCLGSFSGMVARLKEAHKKTDTMLQE